MGKVKPAEEESRPSFEHVSGCFKYFCLFWTDFLFWTGLLPIKIGGKKKVFEFKLVSVSSLCAFVRLLIFTFPSLILNMILIYGGYCKREYEENTGKEWTRSMTLGVGLGQLYLAEYYMNFLIYVLPFAFAFVAVEPFNKQYHCQIEFRNMLIMEDRPSFINVKQVLFPILGFLLLAFSKLLNLIKLWTKSDVVEEGLYMNMYTDACYFMLAHLTLHFLLAMYEQYLYQSFNIFHVMSRLTFNTNDRSTLLLRSKMLPDMMEAIQGGFGFFILVDITLMLIYWLLHLYHAYFTFQVKSIRINFHFQFSSQESFLAASASALIILAEFSRVLLLSDTSSK